MVNSKRLYNGCRVEGSHGPLVPNPNPNVKRRVREKVVGTILAPAGLHKWDVIFDFNGKRQTVSSSSLKLVEDNKGIPLNEVTNTITNDLNMISVSVSIIVFVF